MFYTASNPRSRLGTTKIKSDSKLNSASKRDDDEIESHRKMADMVNSCLVSEAMDNESESDHFMS